MLAGMGVILYPVESSMISHVGYDEAARTLTLLFHSGKRYEYGGVEREVYEALRAAPSAGSFFREEIDGCYPYSQVKGRR